MAVFKDHNKWSPMLVGFFILVVCLTVIYLYSISGTVLTQEGGSKILTGLYSGLLLIFITGILALWSAFRSRKEVMIFDDHDRSLNGHVLTVRRTTAHHAGAERDASAPEVITIYGEDKSIRYISPAAEAILGYKPADMIGEKDFEKVHPDHRPSFIHIFARLKENPLEKIQLQYAYKSKEGNYIWLEATGSNGFSNPDVNGYLFKATDITARRLEEEAERMRSKIQALSENSPDLIIRLEEGTITYINPVIEYYTGKTPVAFINKKTAETVLNPTVLEALEKIVQGAADSAGKIVQEMDFPCMLGKRILQVHAVPEYDSGANLESVLIVSHDITERKKIELEIRHQNKKITESIAYAKRIQTAILPNSRLINRALPDSFILYKPRDVVSGDFPWFAQVKDDIFMAAVDCTGHGVPGALLSLIGYFLLNDIVRSRRITDPGRILDLLDEGVSTTLRPGDDAGSKDGMDMSLCKINLETREVEYAGAHRPLYWMRKGEFHEIKGNKFPIGGGIFKNQTSFTNHKLKLDRGDSIYFCSDGFCDQFGGDEGKKFGGRRLRELVISTHMLPMKEAQRAFEDEWLKWKRHQRQTDDVLLIGVKF
ncbi:MAG TPA: PAS domain S-box protein [Chryseosolibacter sp.]|nr:PAS domain S-box protein [Chryseosolibacter sp.]